MPKIPFTVSARTAKLIGQENFTNAEGAIIELVKNSYDADAKTALIIFDNVDESKANHSIYIIDNGHGMTEKIIKDKWMQIGTEDKLQNYTSEGGRIKTGAKGIGRFALDRLGRFTELRTTSKENKMSLLWAVNWKDFETVGLSINQVKANLSVLSKFDISVYLKNLFSDYKPIMDVLNKTNFATGTILEIKVLKDSWDEKDLKSLFDNLEVLVPPREQPEFSIFLFNTKNINDLGAVNTAYFDDYDYKVSADYSADEEQSLHVTITRNELDVNALTDGYRELFDFEQMKKYPFRLKDFKAKEIEFNLTLKDLKGFSSIDQDLLKKIGEFDFTFYFLKNRVSDDKSEGDLKKYPYRSFVSANRVAWLDKFGGVKIFRDGFRVRPYGEKGTDWLQLGERQAISPQGAGQRLGAYRIRPNQIAGTINISRISNPYFNDKSGREGIQENDVFVVFKNLLIEVINLFERDRNIVMFHLSELYNERFEDQKDRERAKAEAERILREKRAREQSKYRTPKNTTEAEELLASAAEKYEQELEEKESEIRLLRSLASIGLIMSSSAHELKSLRQRIVPRTDYLTRELKKYISDKSLIRVNKDDNPFYMIGLMKEEDLKIKHWLDYSLNSLKKDKRKRTNIDFNDYFKKFKSTWKKSLETRGVQLILNGATNAPNSIQAFEVDLDAVFNNLLTNSFEALKGIRDKQINISWGKAGEFIQIDFTDNGRGLASEYKQTPSEIFNPYETSKRDNKGNIVGTGLGLYIVKSIIDEYNDATIYIVPAQSGFQLRLTFPMRRKQKNV
jgi:signal transduction histidine kinase